MRRPSIVLGLSSILAAAVVLNCGDDDDAGVGTPDSGTTDTGSRGDSSTPPPADGGTEAAIEAGPAGRTIYGVDDSTMLLAWSSTAPGTVTKTAITGLATSETVHGIDFRPKDGTLYALGSTGAVYIIAPATGVATSVAGGDAGVTTFPLILDPAATSFGFDFNPPADRIRVHTNTGKNYRLHPADGQSVNLAGDPDLATDAGTPVSVVATAYTNSVSATPTVTKLYGIDPQLDQLLTFAIAPGFADATPVGPLGVDAEDVAGFDIFGGVGGGDGGPSVNTPLEAYAALRVGGITGLYTIDLATGKATLAGAIGTDKALRGIAVKP